MPSVIESVLEDFDDLDLEGEPEGLAAAEVWEETEGVPMGIGTDVWDEEVTKNLNVLYAFVFPVPG